MKKEEDVDVCEMKDEEKAEEKRDAGAEEGRGGGAPGPGRGEAVVERGALPARAACGIRVLKVGSV